MFPDILFFLDPPYQKVEDKPSQKHVEQLRRRAERAEKKAKVVTGKAAASEANTAVDGEEGGRGHSAYVCA